MKSGDLILSFDEINNIKSFLGLKRFLFLLRIFNKISKNKKEEKKTKNMFDMVIEEKLNHIGICKKLMDILFKFDLMKDYMDYSSASEEDIDYIEFEQAEA